MTRIDSSPIDSYLETLFALGGTDLLLTAGAAPLCRVDGRLEPLEGEAKLTSDDTSRLILGCLSDEAAAGLSAERELDFSFNWRSRARFRGNAFFQRQSLALSLRLIPFDIPTMADLGIPAAVEQFLTPAQGLVLVTGPTGSGKSTTLAAMLEWLNERRPAHIITIEEPIEYLHAHKRAAFDQREVGDDTTSFQRALRSVLREDPDIVLVGEMRDHESIQATLTIAETGHLVFATLHTNDTATAIDRIVDVFPSDRRDQIRLQLSAVLLGVMAQRLVPRTGSGLVAAFEILVATPAVRNLIREGKTPQVRNAMVTGRRYGMQTLEMDLSRLLAEGAISMDDAVARAVVPKELSGSASGHMMRPRAKGA